MVQIPAGLAIHPEGTRSAEELSEPEGGAGSNASTPVHDLVDPLVGDADGVGEIALGESHGTEKFLEEHLPRMGRLTVCRDANHKNLRGNRSPGHLRPGIGPPETDPVLIIDPDAVLPRAVTLQELKTIPGRYLEIAQRLSLIQRIEFPSADPPQLLRQPLPGCLGVSSIEKVLRSRVPEAADPAWHGYHATASREGGPRTTAG